LGPIAGRNACHENTGVEQVAFLRQLCVPSVWESCTTASNVSYNLYKDGTKLAKVTDSTNYLDAAGTATSKYAVSIGQVAFENSAYNQPPHVGFHIGVGMADPPVPDIFIVN
jgi:hypothetical protein